MIFPDGCATGQLGEGQRLFSRPLSLEAAESAEKEKNSLGVILK
jgi:hypothetical protein